MVWELNDHQRTILTCDRNVWTRLCPPDGGAGAAVRHFDYDVHPITGKSITPAQIRNKSDDKEPTRRLREALGLVKKEHDPKENKQCSTDGTTT